MNGLKYAVLSLAVLACFDGSAKRKNKKAKKAETVRGGYMFRRHVQLCHGYG